jgi:hypothetical protein
MMALFAAFVSAARQLLRSYLHLLVRSCNLLPAWFAWSSRPHCHGTLIEATAIEL